MHVDSYSIKKSSVCIASCAYQYYIIIFNNIKIIGKFAGLPQSKKEHSFALYMKVAVL